MVYLKCKDEFIDSCFSNLTIFLQMIDCELSKIDSKIVYSRDPTSEGLCDLGEYLIGYGFIAMQRYIVSTYPQNGKNKKESLKHGIKLYDDLFLIEVINAGANYCKHEPEWPYNVEHGNADEDGMTPIKVNRSDNDLSDLQKKSFNIITTLTPYADYTLSNLLAEILKRISYDSSLSFAPILPFIEQWRKELDEAKR